MVPRESEAELADHAPLTQGYRRDVDIVVVGAGVFGATASLELSRRGHSVTLVDPGPLPHPNAASSDISKMVRMDYGTDELYYEMMEASFPLWREWNEAWGQDLFHEDGYLVIAGGPLADGGYEADCLATLAKRGHEVELVDADWLADRTPAWSVPDDTEGYYNPVGGWAESANVVTRVLRESVGAGTEFVEAPLSGFLGGGDEVEGIATADGGVLNADIVVLAAGTWAPKILPELDDVMWSVGQPVYHFDVEDASDWQPPEFLPWAMDVANTGWYGFVALDEGVLKVANHGPGDLDDPDGHRDLPEESEDMFRDFLDDHLPDIVDADIVDTRLCFYADTFDGDFWIDHHPDRSGLVVAGGGSGHAFKFAPVLGGLIADAVEEESNQWLERFAWREAGERTTEEARFS